MIYSWANVNLHTQKQYKNYEYKGKREPKVKWNEDKLKLRIEGKGKFFLKMLRIKNPNFFENFILYCLVTWDREEKNISSKGKRERGYEMKWKGEKEELIKKNDFLKKVF